MAASGRKVASAYVDIGANYAQFTRGLSSVKKSLAGLQPTFTAVRSLAKGLFAGLVGAAAFGVKSFSDAEQETRRLESALAATGQEVSANVARFSELASKIQGATVYEDDAIKGLMAYATNLGVTADQMESVTKLGIGLGEALFGGDAKAGIEAMSKAMQGNMKALAKMVPGMRDAKTVQEQLALVVKAGNSGWQQAQDNAKTTRGAIMQASNAFGDLAESVGEVLAPYMVQAAQAIKGVAAALASIGPAQQQQIVKWAAIAAGIAGLIVIAPSVAGALGGIAAALVAVGGVAASIGAILITPLVLAAAAAVAVGYAIYRSREAIASFVSAAVNSFPKIVSAVKGAGRYIVEAFGGIASNVGDLFGGFMTGVVDGAISLGKTIASVADTMFGSLPGFVAGLVTIWNQAGYVLLNIWFRVKASVLNIWEDIKHAGLSVFYYWGGVIAGWASTTLGVMKELAVNVGSIWNTMIDGIAGKMARAITNIQAERTIWTTFSEGQQVDPAAIKKMVGLGIGKGDTPQQQEADILRRFEIGSTLDGEAMDRLVVSLTENGWKYQEELARKAREAKDKEYAARIEAIGRETDAAVAAVEKWSTEGLSAANEGRDKSQAANTRQREVDLAASNEAAKKQLAEDLAKIQKMPKLSEQITALLDAVKKGLAFDEIKKQIDAIRKGITSTIPGIEPGKLAPNGNIGGTSLDESFQARVRLLAARGTNRLDPKSNEAARMRMEDRRMRQHEITVLEAIKVNTAKRQLAQLG